MVDWLICWVGRLIGLWDDVIGNNVRLLISWFVGFEKLIDLSIQALYVKDGTYHEAVIEEINKDQVTVKFVGYQVILSIDWTLLIGLIELYLSDWLIDWLIGIM